MKMMAMLEKHQRWVDHGNNMEYYLSPGTFETAPTGFETSHSPEDA